MRDFFNPAFHFSMQNSLPDFSHIDDENFNAFQKDFLTFAPFYFNYANLAMNISKIIFPKEYKQLKSDLLEKIIYYKGRAAFIRDKTNGFMITDFVPVSNSFNWFNKPVQIRPVNIFSTNSQTFPILNEEDFVIIEANDFWYPTGITVWSFSNAIAQAYESAYNNTKRQKFPIVFQGTKNQKLTMQQLAGNIQKDFEYIFLDKELNLDDITVLDVSGKFLSKEILDVVDRYKSQLLELLGVKNVGVVKQSGISDVEINSNNELTTLFSDIAIQKKEEACAEIKEKFGINCYVQDLLRNEVEDDGSLYDDN